METITHTDFWGQTRVYEPVTEVPHGYSVWNIGRKNFPYERRVPLCKPGYNEYVWQRNIDVNALKYIEVETEELALCILKEASRKGVSRDRFYEIVSDYAQFKIQN